ncbi:GerAB/ArcD/ProY family transporter [Clostridiaceae bacterium NSJ-31]|uniref:GerAB/ArcD/ProY family transporter n=2 Tax=Ligaoa zhengdingensis TaxID=2763658 RepID=A0A926DXA4_9FIRM|nr:GerAB/ArcD/ProY family transporter [Ligaoa zhengdingensis]MBC8545547.1 GerAB/ArcD/ProY family transporter [Ligaoa zhengdingensis]
MTRNTIISSKQVVLLLVLFRVFDLLTFVPQIGGRQNGATVMLALPFSYLLLALILVPALLLLRGRREGNVVDCALALNPAAGKVLAALLFLFSVFAAADTVSNFEFLLTSAIYPETPSLFFVLTFTAVCLYGAFLGLEPVARVNTFVFVLFVGALVFISASVLPKSDFVYLKNPLQGGLSAVWGHALSAAFSNFDAVLFLLFAPNFKGSLSKCFWGWALLTVAMVEYLVMLLTVGLGDFAASQMFPFYSLAAFADLSIFQRLDSLHITLWTFIAFVKVSVYLYFASQCLGYLVPRRLKKTRLAATGILTAAGALVISSDLRFLTAVQKAMATGIPVAVLAVLIPFVLLLWSLIARRKERAR